ncbi:L,D-transpeptidase [Lentilitoribacter sp. Alg239-R112]|uniref:L,D-transpeptidase n=1 Tax=Lentilitoribacter sp. Alg239-R112 TaxID=2305987 RepID=UPI0013A6D0BA|nr:L,D-transpeptidase [Lentilitoribacter sp. Alg239-R112]
MKFSRIGLLIAATAIFASPTMANDRYRTKPPVTVSPSLESTWVLQLNGGQVRSRSVQRVQRRQKQRVVRRSLTTGEQRSGVVIRQAAVAPAAKKKAVKPQLSAQFLPQLVNYESDKKVGSIVIDTQTKHLYLILGDGKARRYGVGVGKQGFEWTGSEKITRKGEWPSWRPPAEMIAREKKKGRILPTHMEGGPQNPLGARALYLGSTLYRIHGTNQPWTIGQAVSSGCIRMRNQDVVDLYERVKVGARVTVI